ncbi:hypothetical protein V8E52_003281 [Russula decolorans]
MFIGDMMHVTNKVFSIILSAYVEGLAASIKASCEGLPALSQTSGLSTYKSIEQLDVVLDFAKQCLFRFKEPVDNMENVEKKSCEAIELLTKSVALSLMFLTIWEKKTHEVKMN